MLRPIPRDMEQYDAGLEAVGCQHGRRSLVRQKPSVIAVPEFHPERVKISGYAFSRRLKRAGVVPALKIPTSENEWSALIAHKSIVEQIKQDSDGGPTIDENRIKISIDGTNANAGSNANYLWLRFSVDKKLKLWGIDHTRFPKG